MPRFLAVAPVLLLALGLPSPACAAQESSSAREGDAVVLLHGLLRSDRAMRHMAQHMETAGLQVRNVRYPSRSATPGDLVIQLEGELDACCRGSRRVHFVAHSLGAIIVRAYLSEHELPNLGRVVMLSPPNRGTQLVDVLGRVPLGRRALGRAAVELGTAPDSLPNRLPPPTFPVGIIASTRSRNPIGSVLIPGDDDGAVAVENMRLDGMSDFIKVRRSHTSIKKAPEVAEQALHFLRHGQFQHVPDPRDGP